MKKLLCVMLCLGLLMGCSSNNENKNNPTDSNTTSVEESDKEFYKSKIKDTELYLTDHVKEIEEIEKILIDSGYTYTTDDGDLALLNPLIEKGRVISYSKSDNASMIIMQISNNRNFVFMKKVDGDTMVVLGDNGNVKWGYEHNVPLNDYQPDLEDLFQISEIKEGYNEWGKQHNLSFIEVKYLLDIYYDVLIKGNNTNIVNIKMEKFSEEYYKK